MIFEKVLIWHKILTGVGPVHLKEMAIRVARRHRTGDLAKAAAGRHLFGKATESFDRLATEMSATAKADHLVTEARATESFDHLATEMSATAKADQLVTEAKATESFDHLATEARVRPRAALFVRKRRGELFPEKEQ